MNKSCECNNYNNNKLNYTKNNKVIYKIIIRSISISSINCIISMKSNSVTSVYSLLIHVHL